MSYIDSYKHEIVGLFGNLPVYHPLENIAGSGDGAGSDFSCSMGSLVIGGGAGEHPGIVLDSAKAAVADFVYLSGDFELTDKLKSYLSEVIGMAPYFDFAGWSTEDHFDFYKHCTESCLPNPFGPESEITLETWLHLGLGEFIYYSMPQLAEHLIGQVKALHLDPRPMRYNNITVIPPGMPVFASGGNAFFKT